MQKPHILIFALVYHPFIGGAEVAVKELTDRMDEIDFTLITARLKRSLPKEERISNVNVIRVGWGCKLDKFLFPCFGYRKALKLIKSHSQCHLEQCHPEPVEGREMVYQLSPIVALWSLMANPAGLATLFTHKKTKIPYLLTQQEGDPESYYIKRVWWYWPLYMQIFRQATAIQTISKYLAERSRRYGFTGHLEIIPNGVDIPRFTRKYFDEELHEIRVRYDINDDEIVIITTSRLSHKNGIDTLIDGFSLLTKRIGNKLPLRLLIAGSGEDKHELKDQVHNLKLEKFVTFTGHIDHNELPKLLKISHIFIRPSRSEGLGNSFLEALAAGLPIVGTMVGGIPDFLKDGVTGIPCTPDNPASVSDALMLLIQNPALAQQTQKNGAELVEKEYNWDILAEKMKVLLARVSQE